MPVPLPVPVSSMALTHLDSFVIGLNPQRLCPNPRQSSPLVQANDPRLRPLLIPPPPGAVSPIRPQLSAAALAAAAWDPKQSASGDVRVIPRKPRATFGIYEMVQAGLLHIGDELTCKGHTAVINNEAQLQWTHDGRTNTANNIRLFAENVGDRSKRCWHVVCTSDGAPMVKLRDEYLRMLESQGS